MKRMIAILLTIASCLPLFGCSVEITLAPTQATVEATEETPTVAPTQVPTEEENAAGETTKKATAGANQEQNKRPAATNSSGSVMVTNKVTAEATKTQNASSAATKQTNKRPTETKVSAAVTTKATVQATTRVPGAESSQAAVTMPSKAPAAAATQSGNHQIAATQSVATQSTQAADHKHSFGEWTLQEASSCVVEGKEVRRCECGFAENRTLPLEDHKMNGQNVCRTCRKVIFDDNAALVELGVVCDSWYGSGSVANKVWDIRVWNGKVYRAAGDYDTNSGATTILAYDIANRVWDASYKAKDEAIHGFVEIGGKLVAPGIDATQSWEYGNYYVLGDDGKWQQVRNLPNGVHCFDMIECDGKVFAGLGTETVGDTVAVSNDGGKTFSFASLCKDGNDYDLSKYDHSRTYEFVQLEGTVYALIALYPKKGSATWGIFRYEDGKMHYMAEGTKLLDGSEFSRKYFGGDFEFNGTCFLTARRLYAIKDFSDPSTWQTISMPNSGKVSDAILYNGAIYVLSSRQDMTTKVYHVKIYKSTTGEPGSFEEVASYDHSGFPLSFDYDGTHFYVGTGIDALDKSKNGMVLRVKPQE